jgi:uncharacterized membrane protein
MKVQLIASAVFCVLGTMLLFKTLPPNRWLGLCTPRTISSPEVWYRAHQAFGCVLLATGLLVSALTLWPATSVHRVWGLIVVLTVAGATVFVYRRYAA